MGYLEYIKQNYDNEFCKSILNSSAESLPHKLELLKSEKAKIRLEIKQVFNDGIDDYINLHRTSSKLKNEINKVKDDSTTLKSKIESTLAHIKNIKQEKGKIDQINKKIDIYKSLNLNQSDILTVFDISNLIKLCTKTESYQEAYNLFTWFKKFTLSKSNKNGRAKEYFENQYEGIKQNIIDYLFYNIKKQKFNKLLPLIKSLIQEGDFNIEEISQNLFIIFYSYKLKRGFDKLNIHRSSAEFIPKAISLYVKNFEKAFLLVLKILNTSEKKLEPEKFMHYILKHNNRWNKYIKYIIRKNDDDFFFLLGHEISNYELSTNIDFMVYVKEIADEIHAKNYHNILKKFKVYLRYINFHNSFIWMKDINPNNFNLAINDTESNQDTKKKSLEENLVKLLSLKKGNEIGKLFFNNGNSLFWHQKIFEREHNPEVLAKQLLILAHYFKRESKIVIIDYCDPTISENLCETVDFLIDNIAKNMVGLLKL